MNKQIININETGNISNAIINDKDSASMQGEKIINTNNFLRELSELMEDEKFNKFF